MGYSRTDCLISDAALHFRNIRRTDLFGGAPSCIELDGKLGRFHVPHANIADGPRSKGRMRRLSAHASDPAGAFLYAARRHTPVAHQKSPISLVHCLTHLARRLKR
jgi:hypothetical protein